jgi:hypothetical protein
MCRRPLHRCAALIAAYAIALQALLSAFAIVPPVALADPAFAICQPGGADPAGQRPHDPCAACAAHCAASAPSQRVAIVLPWPRDIISSAASGSAALPPAPLERQHSPRAPPLG